MPIVLGGFFYGDIHYLTFIWIAIQIFWVLL